LWIVQRFCLFVCAIVASSSAARSAFAQRAILKDGRELDGRFMQIAKVFEDPAKIDPEALTPILVCDDELRRTMAPVSRLANLSNIGREESPVQFRIEQQVAAGVKRVAGVGPIVQITPFDEHGRRVFSMMTNMGRVDVIQGITLITPTYTKVEGLKAQNGTFVWDMRIATSSIPRDALRKIIHNQIDAKNITQRLTLVKLFMQAERYFDAEAELKDVIKDFPNEDAPKETIGGLRQLAARVLLKEILARKAAGQHKTAFGYLKNFPTQGVANTILQQVREELDGYTKLNEQRDKTIARLRELIKEMKDPQIEKIYTDATKEIEAELSFNNIDRLASFRRLESDQSLSAEQRLALAISGWLLGADQADLNSQIALNLYDARNRTREYLAETDSLKRDGIFQRLESLTGVTAMQTAALVANMKPPVETAPATGTDYLELEVPGGPGEGNYTYYVLLPPEYDPFRSYPAVVTLNGAGTTPLQQMDWWAGAASQRGRLGQATRHGYIVIAPAWTRDHQEKYEGSALEHNIVLRSLRDACRRFSIDTDRVYLSGHSMGGDAAWDIGVSHPDLWAGIVPIVATTTKSTINHYTANAATLPMYFVCGELDASRMQENSLDWDRYFVRNYDITVVEYRGRGHEHFSDEIQRIFDWMGRKQRDFFPKKITAATKRPWDHYFWWIEMDRLPPQGVNRALVVEGTINANNGINVKAPGAVSLYLSPRMFDLSRAGTITINGRSLPKKPIQPDLRVLLDDVRTRGERQHPFWAKVEAAGAR
jgi:predicted esterase